MLPFKVMKYSFEGSSDEVRQWLMSVTNDREFRGLRSDWKDKKAILWRPTPLWFVNPSNPFFIGKIVEFKGHVAFAGHFRPSIIALTFFAVSIIVEICHFVFFRSAIDMVATYQESTFKYIFFEVYTLSLFLSAFLFVGWLVGLINEYKIHRALVAAERNWRNKNFQPTRQRPARLGLSNRQRPMVGKGTENP